MDWKGGRRSNNIDDQRNAPLAAGVAGGSLIALLFRFVPFLLGTKFGRIILVFGAVIFFGAKFLGIDLMQASNTSPTTNNSQLSHNSPQRPPQAANTQDQELADFVSVILADTEDIWHAQFQTMGKNYQEPVLTLFRGSVNSACGLGQAAMGPFYCPGDKKLYIDLSFYQEMKTKLGAPGDFAQAYVIAHEVGHHVQNLLGISAKITQAQRNTSTVSANALSVKLELQADCFAGIWGHFSAQNRQWLETGDIEEALNAAAAIGDDKLQREATGNVRPEAFTHGTSQQRVESFKRGFQSGDINACNRFK